MSNWTRNLAAAAVMALFSIGQANAIVIGHYDGSKESFGLAGTYISAAKTDLGTFGHTLSSTTAMTAAFLSTVDAVYIGLLSSSASAAEKTALSAFVSSGGLMVIQQDHSSGGWHAHANDLLGDYGIHATGIGGSDLHTVTVASHALSTTPNVITGLTFSGSAKAWFDVLGGATMIASVASESRTTVLQKLVGSGSLVASSDIDMWSGAGSYGSAGSGSVNARLWENIWASAVPEPSALTLLGLSLVGLGLVRRRASTAA